jgi:hypothetical protein
MPSSIPPLSAKWHQSSNGTTQNLLISEPGDTSTYHDRSVLAVADQGHGLRGPGNVVRGLLAELEHFKHYLTV